MGNNLIDSEFGQELLHRIRQKQRKMLRKLRIIGENEAARKIDEDEPDYDGPPPRQS